MGDLIPIGKDLSEFRYDDSQLELLKNTVAKNQNLTNDEFLLMGYISQQSGLDPFLRQIYPIKFGDSKTDQKTLVFITGIDGYRLIAERTNKYAGRDEYLFDEGLTTFQMLEKKRTLPRIATCTVYKMLQGVRCPTTSSIRWSEYYPKQQSKQWNWNRMPFLMSGKTAEALSLRSAFPNNYKGIYLDAEFDQSEARPSYNVAEDNVDVINNIEEMYGILGYNDAKKIQVNMKHTGESELGRVQKEQLEMLAYHLNGKVEKQNAET